MNPARQTYDYQNGRGLDGFLSGAIDEVSWETNLSSTVNTLSQSPIGQSNSYSNTAINYDLSQISGSQGGSTSLGGAGGGSAGTGGSGNLQIDPTKNRITLSDNDISVLLGRLPDSSDGLRLETASGVGVGQFSKWPDGSVALRISQPGLEVTQAALGQLVFNSSQDVFKIVKSGTGTAPSVTTVSDGTNTYSGFATNLIPHGLGFTPLVMAFVQTSSGQYTLMPYSEVVSASAPTGGIISTFYRVTTDATYITIFTYVVSYSPGIGAGTYSSANIKYFLLQETAA